MRKPLTIIMVLCLMVGFAPGYCRAAENASAASVKLEDAINLALTNQKVLKTSQLDVDAAKYAMDQAWDNNTAALRRTYDPATGMYVSTATGSDPQGSVYSTYSAWLTKNKSYDAQVDTVVLSTYQKYFAVTTAINNLEASRLTSQQDSEKARIADLSYQLGMTTSSDSDKARMQANSSQSNYLAAQKALDQAYRSFALYVGLPEDSQPTLDSSIEYKPVTIDDPDTMINSIADSSPSVWMANQTVILASETYGMSNSYTIEDINKKKNSYALQTAQENARTTVRSYYVKLKGYEDSYASVEQGLKIAQQTLKITQLKYDLGLATKVNVMTDEAALVSAKNTYNNLVLQHEIYTMAFNKPWAFSGN